MLLNKLWCILIVILLIETTINAEERERKRKNRKSNRRRLKEFRVKGTSVQVSVIGKYARPFHRKWIKQSTECVTTTTSLYNVGESDVDRGFI